MKFIAPEFLYALGFLAIPILIHLFNFRRYKTVQFSQVRFLKSVKKQTQSTSKLKHLIVLLCRLLALACIVFAFAQPIIVEQNSSVKAGKKGVIIYLDNSFSMQSNAEASNLLSIAKTQAISIVESFSASDRFQLITNNFDGSELRWLTKDAFINKLQQVDFSPIFRSIDQVIQRTNANSNKDEFTISKYFISDLQAINYNLSELKNITDSTELTFLNLKADKVENAWIKSAETFQPFHLPELSEQLSFKVKQQAEEEKAYNGKLYLNKQLKNPFNISEFEDSTSQILNYKNPSTTEVLGELIIKDYPVTFDDTLYFNYPLNKKINVVQLYSTSENKNLTQLFNNDSLINYQTVNNQQLDLELISSANFVIVTNLIEFSSGLNNVLQELVEKGGSILLLPNNNTNGINNFLKNYGLYYSAYKNDSTEVADLNLQARVFNDVFEKKPENINLPKVSNYSPFNSLKQLSNENILGLKNGVSMLKKYNVNNGKIYLSAVNLNPENSTFANHAIFVPLVFNMALQSILAQPLSFEIGERSVIVEANSLSESPLRIKSNDSEFIPKQFKVVNGIELILGNNIKKAGHYSIVQGDEILGSLSFNYNRNESQLTFLSTNDLKEMLNNTKLKYKLIANSNVTLSQEIKQSENGISLWKYFIAFALLFLGLEILFLRILKG